MTTLTLAIVIVFCIGYFFIAIESVTKINKAAIALLMLVVTWTLFMLEPASYLPRAVGDQMASVVNEAIERHLGSTSTTLFFLMGAMTELPVPAMVSMVIPVYLLSISLKGQLTFIEKQSQNVRVSDLTSMQRKVIFFLGVGGLVSVPIFKSITHLPPFLGILMAVAGLLHRCRRLNAHYRQCCRCGSDGAGEDYLRMVHEAHFMGRLPRLYCWHPVLLD